MASAYWTRQQIEKENKKYKKYYAMQCGTFLNDKKDKKRLRHPHPLGFKNNFDNFDKLASAFF